MGTDNINEDVGPLVPASTDTKGREVVRKNEDVKKTVKPKLVK